MEFLLIDDHALFLDGLKGVLKRLQSGIQIHRASTFGAGLDLARSKRKLDLILLDIGLPDASGTQGLRELRRAAPSAPVVLLSAQDDPLTVSAGLEAGANGFFSKSISGSELLSGLKKVLKGEVVVLAGRGQNKKVPRLTKRQKDVLGLLVQGRSNKAIAESLGMAANTVRSHLAAIFRALGATSRTQAATEALKKGLVRHDA